MCCAGIESQQALQKRIGGGSVRCDIKNRDQYGRAVAVCFGKGSEDLNAWMAANGEAVAYTEYSKDYVSAADDARLSRKVTLQRTRRHDPSLSRCSACRAPSKRMLSIPECGHRD